ncbi:MAG: hypothetical protein ACI9WU_000808 [Myxococcota bacterium]|jgi:hypothetical protein
MRPALAALLLSALLGCQAENDLVVIGAPEVIEGGTPDTSSTQKEAGPAPGQCVPGSTLGCVTQYSRKICNTDGTAFEEVPCPAGNICAGAGTCVQAKCVPGQTVCLGPETVAVCAADGSEFEPGDTCKTGLSCVEGECISSCNSADKAQTNVGCNYALVDLGNFESFPQGSSSDRPVVVVVSNTLADEAAHIQLFSNATNSMLPFTAEELTVPPQDLRTFELPTGNAQLTTSINRGSWDLTSDQPVTVHLINPANGPDVRSNDATLLFPTDALGIEYLVMGWKSFWSEAQGFDDNGYPKYGFPSYLTVVATSQGTTQVAITPTANIRAGSVNDSTFVDHVTAGETAVYTLNQGDVLNYTIEPQLGDNHDLTGSVVSSSKSVAAFSAHNCAFVPSIAVKFCDHLEHQLTPVDTWVNVYVADLFEPRAQGGYDVWRIMAGEDETVVNTDPAVPEVAGIILNKGEWVEYQAAYPHVISATGPVQVGHFMTGSNIVDAAGEDIFDPVCGDNLTGIGDPAFTVGVGTSQFLDSYIVLTPPGYTDDWMNIIRRAGTSITLDGENLGGTGVLVGNTTWELLRVPLEDGVHRLESDTAFGVTAYGYDCDVSYAYPGGILFSAGE